MEKNIVLNENGIGVFTAPIHKLTPDDLPPVDKYVLIYVPLRPWIDSTDFRNVYWKTAKLAKDYYFDGFGLDSYTIDEVKYWMELPNIPKEICETYKEYEERNRTYTHIVFSNDGGETISGTSGIQDTDTHFGYIRDNKKELDESSKEKSLIEKKQFVKGETKNCFWIPEQTPSNKTDQLKKPLE